MLVPLLLIGGLVAYFVYFTQDRAGTRALDADLCPLEPGAIAGSATLLLDFRKPLDEAHRDAPGVLLDELTLALGGNTELRVFSLTADAVAPRQALARLCKPYDNAELSVHTAKDQGRGVRECDDLPAQLPDGLREAAGSFCARRDTVRRQIDALAQRSVTPPVGDAYLIEALDDTALEFADRPTPHALHIFSDMLHHAQWYSHLELDWTDWNLADFLVRHEARYPSAGRRPSLAGLRVEVSYVPRRGLTAEPRARQAHKRFWREFLGSAQVTFQDQPANGEYAIAPRMFIPTEAEVAAREREAAEREREIAEREREAAERERAEAQRLLAEARREQARLEDIQEQRERERQELEERMREREAELQRLQALGQEQPQPQPRQLRQPQTVPQDPDDVPGAALPSDGDLGDTLPPDGDPGSTVPPDGDPSPTPPSDEDPSPALSPDDDTGTTVPPDSDPRPTPPSDADLADSGSDDDAAPTPAAAAQAAPCDIELAPDSSAAAPYPAAGQFNFGNASIVVRYTVDAEGATVDDEVRVDRAASSVTRARHFERFANIVVRTVRDWEFEFEDAADRGCVRRQERTTTFEFRHD